ncbi:hypothetical protein [Priestia abyssalis]|uniref:hypothetical protein n=1 Tax=Priestia abyssalis TaxID=1221450 RepID=UPI001474FF50|nr:hypothetical protein [Priestia abyssalis]
MEKPLQKPPYYDGSGSLYPKEEKNTLNRPKQFVITPEMRKNLSGNPYITSK